MLPTEMKAVLVDAWHDSIADAIAALRIGQRPVPALKPGQVLVQMEAAPCNPSDLVFLVGKYGVRKPLPAVPGWEGAGTVIAGGGGLLAGWLQGKRVACSSRMDGDGTWAEYCVADARRCIPLTAQISSEQGASLIINPLTAIGLLETARRAGHRAAVQTAAASQLGRMLLVVAADAGYPLISVVRREEQVALLKSLGARHVLNSETPDFVEQLRECCAELQATAAFDAVGGPMTGTLLSAMPDGSTAFVYGALSEQPCSGINPVGLIFRRQKIDGFYLPTWLESRGVLAGLLAARRVRRLLAEGRIATRVQRRLSLAEVPAGLQQYVEHMTDGKVVIAM